MIRLARFVVIGGAILCTGCGTQLLSDAGPNALAVKSGVTCGPPYGLVKLSPEVVNILEEYGPRTLSAFIPRPSSAAQDQVRDWRRGRRQHLRGRGRRPVHPE